ncbi:MAG: hypothetical protein WEB59_02780 [Thermoanaerobaculia bacterium]
MARKLRKMGFDAAALRGGLEAWRKAAGSAPAPIRPPRTESPAFEV